MKLFSYVVQHDTGYAPNPYFGICTLCRCKYRGCAKKPKNVVELAKEGNWVVGTGGASQRSAGHGKLVYAMRVDKTLTREQYYACPRFAKKKPVENGTYQQRRGDNKRPRTRFERREQFALISRHFYYFGANAIAIPKKDFPHLEKRGPGFRSDFDEKYIDRFVTWLEKGYKTGKQGEPCMKDERDSERKGSRGCKSSCFESA